MDNLRVKLAAREIEEDNFDDSILDIEQRMAQYIAHAVFEKLKTAEKCPSRWHRNTISLHVPDAGDILKAKALIEARGYEVAINGRYLVVSVPK